MEAKAAPTRKELLLAYVAQVKDRDAKEAEGAEALQLIQKLDPALTEPVVREKSRKLIHHYRLALNEAGRVLNKRFAADTDTKGFQLFHALKVYGMVREDLEALAPSLASTRNQLLALWPGKTDDDFREVLDRLLQWEAKEKQLQEEKEAIMRGELPRVQEVTPLPLTTPAPVQSTTPAPAQLSIPGTEKEVVVPPTQDPLTRLPEDMLAPPASSVPVDPSNPWYYPSTGRKAGLQARRSWYMKKKMWLLMGEDTLKTEEMVTRMDNAGVYCAWAGGSYHLSDALLRASHKERRKADEGPPVFQRVNNNRTFRRLPGVPAPTIFQEEVEANYASPPWNPDAPSSFEKSILAVLSLPGKTIWQEHQILKELEDRNWVISTITPTKTILHGTLLGMIRAGEIVYVPSMLWNSEKLLYVPNENHGYMYPTNEYPAPKEAIRRVLGADAHTPEVILDKLHKRGWISNMNKPVEYIESLLKDKTGFFEPAPKEAGLNHYWVKAEHRV